MKFEICVIGSETLLFPFLQFGFAIYTPPSDDALRAYLQDVIDQGYGIIYIEDSYCFAVADILEKYRENLTPIFVPIGESEGEDSYSRQMVRKMMESAVGINIL